jgi:hypothetical protein
MTHYLRARISTASKPAPQLSAHRQTHWLGALQPCFINGGSGAQGPSPDSRCTAQAATSLKHQFIAPFGAVFGAAVIGASNCCALQQVRELKAIKDAFTRLMGDHRKLHRQLQEKEAGYAVRLGCITSCLLQGVVFIGGPSCNQRDSSSRSLHCCIALPACLLITVGQ